jgi:SAM-dependent methyltransferase
MRGVDPQQPVGQPDPYVLEELEILYRTAGNEARAEYYANRKSSTAYMMRDTDKGFVGSIPEIYERHLVPLIFESYAADMVRRVALLAPARVLEIAAGTGVVTRGLASSLPEDVAIVATDLNQPMLDLADAIGTPRPVQWRVADALNLPFADGAFDVVVCQFGVMFFPDKPRALAQARRVLRPGGTLLFNVWDRIEENEFADIVTRALGVVFPDDPPRFMARTPHGYHDLRDIGRDLAAGGFTAAPRFETVTRRSLAESPRIVAVAYCQGTPLRNEIDARDPARLDEATEVSAEAIAQRFGRGALDGKIQAHVVTIQH